MMSKDRNLRRYLAVLTAIVLITMAHRQLMAAPANALEVRVTRNADKLEPYQVFELTFQHARKYVSPTWDVTIAVTFQSPSGRKLSVGGFFYGSSKPQTPIVVRSEGQGPARANWPCEPADLWKARYAPNEKGRWKYKYVFTNLAGQTAGGSGTFDVIEGRAPKKGFVRINPDNPFRFVFDDGSPFFPIGYQDGIFDNNANGSVMDVSVMEGPFRLDPEGKRPTPPPGAMFARGPSMGPVNGDVTFGRAARAGFNLWRFSPNNFSIKVFADPKDANRATLDHVRWEQAQMVDEMLLMTRKYDMRNFYGIFGYTKIFNDQPDNREGMEKVKRIIKYSVDRWGAYVDFWEFLNEQHAATRWYEIVIPYLESIDPYDHPIATSWERPELPGIEVNAPHWYGNESELVSDRVTADRARSTKQFGKPVVYGEQGNYRGREDRSAEGVGGVWDPGSARRMRVRCWTAMFTEVCFIFWETSYAKDGHVRNIWIGPQERQYIRAMQDFAAMLDRDVRIVEVALSGAAVGNVRAYGLRSDGRVAAYFHHHTCQQCRKADDTKGEAGHTWNHDRGEVRDLEVTIDVPISSICYWYRPTDGAIVASVEARAGRRTLVVPPFSIDLALILTDGALPDTDGDGVANRLDADDDNDGVPDGQDAWPLEREEWADIDGDRIGDNQDADIDGDGKADDRNNNGTPDCDENDWDGDGVPNSGAIPWDAFPRDPKEWRDTDGDGIGDNADTGIGGDGLTEPESAASSQPARLIFDTDIMGDVDDVGTVAVLHALADLGEAEILAMGVSSKNPWSPLCLSALNAYFNRPDIPLGVIKGAAPMKRSKYAEQIAKEFPRQLKSLDDAPEAAMLYRKVLAGEKDQSTVIVTVGFLGNLRNLLQTKPDRLSPLGGRDLVAKKVKAWVCMGGQFPEGREACNLRRDSAAAAYVIDRWPGRVVFSGGELGIRVQTGAGLTKLPPNSPVRRAYELYNGLTNRASWDQTAVLYAVRGLKGGLRNVWDLRKGSMRYDEETAYVKWRDQPQRDHAYLIEKMPAEQVARMIEALMLRLPYACASSQEHR